MSISSISLLEMMINNMVIVSLVYKRNEHTTHRLVRWDNPNFFFDTKELSLNVTILYN